jgi:hypothetical protein
VTCIVTACELVTNNGASLEFDNCVFFSKTGGEIISPFTKDLPILVDLSNLKLHEIYDKCLVTKGV